MFLFNTGIGHNVYLNELNEITQSSYGKVLLVDNFGSLQAVIKTIVDTICEGWCIFSIIHEMALCLFDYMSNVWL